jgi:hypothetical protein
MLPLYSRFEYPPTKLKEEAITLNNITWIHMAMKILNFERKKVDLNSWYSILKHVQNVWL